MTKSDFQIQHTCYTHVKSCVYLCIVQGSTLYRTSTENYEDDADDENDENRENDKNYENEENMNEIDKRIGFINIQKEIKRDLDSEYQELIDIKKLMDVNTDHKAKFKISKIVAESEHSKHKRRNYSQKRIKDMTTLQFSPKSPNFPLFKRSSGKMHATAILKYLKAHYGKMGLPPSFASTSDQFSKKFMPHYAQTATDDFFNNLDLKKRNFVADRFMNSIFSPKGIARGELQPDELSEFFFKNRHPRTRFPETRFQKTRFPEFDPEVVFTQGDPEELGSLSEELEQVHKSQDTRIDGLLKLRKLIKSRSKRGSRTNRTIREKDLLFIDETMARVKTLFREFMIDLYDKAYRVVF